MLFQRQGRGIHRGTAVPFLRQGPWGFELVFNSGTPTPFGKGKVNKEKQTWYNFKKDTRGNDYNLSAY